MANGQIVELPDDFENKVQKEDWATIKVKVKILTSKKVKEEVVEEFTLEDIELTQMINDEEDAWYDKKGL